MKTAVITVVKDSQEYLSSFLSYYKDVFNSIYIVDHNSSIDYRCIKIDNVHIFRSDSVVFFQEEFTNILIDKLDMRAIYDWIFVLDVDEFLPFKSKDELDEFLLKNSHSPVVNFNWQNGAPIRFGNASSDPIHYLDSIQFYKKISNTYKAAVNVKRTGGNFYIRRSSHHIGRREIPFFLKLPILRRKNIYRSSQTEELPLYHVISSSLKNFESKVKNYKTMVSLQKDIPNLGGRMIMKYPDKINNDQWMWYVANYRTRDEALHVAARRDDFFDLNLFSHIENETKRLCTESVYLCPERNTYKEQTEVELDFIRFKSFRNLFSENIKWFSLDFSNRKIEIFNPII